MSNLIVTSHDNHLRVRIENYSSLNKLALSRVLTDLTTTSHVPLPEMLVTVLLTYDSDHCSWKVPVTLSEPPKIGNEPGKSRIWTDFTFQEIGKGEEFLNLESIVEKDPGAVAPGISLPHPYLTAEKAKQVNQWVSAGAQLDPDGAEVDSGTAPRPEPVPESTEATPVPAVKRPPGVKGRKPVSISACPANQSKPRPHTSPEPPKPASRGSEDVVTPPRRKWKMVHDFSPSGAGHSTEQKTASADQSPEKKLSADSACPKTPENMRTVSAFDATKYGLSKTPGHAGRVSKASPHAQNLDKHQKVASKARYPRRNELIDVFSSPKSSPATGQPTFSFDQPALVPQQPPSKPQSQQNSPALKTTTPDDANNLLDLIGLEIESDNTVASTTRATSDTESKSFSTEYPDKKNPDDNERRLVMLRQVLEEEKREVAISDAMGVGKANPVRPRRQPNSDALIKKRLAELERPHKAEEKQAVEESATREFRRTNHKAPNPGQKQKSKAEKKAQRQATLEDAWGGLKKAAAKPTVDSSKPRASESKSAQARTTGRKNQMKTRAEIQSEEHTNQTSRNFFEVLKPVLNVAEYFQGSLSLEVQIGLILIPLLPKTYGGGGGVITLDEWIKIFQSKHGLPAPTTKFINRVTTSGADIDHIVDLNGSKAELKRRLFEQEYSEYSITYEYHCRTTADQELIIVIDEQGNYTVKKPTTQIGAVNLHFPGQIWDASAIVSGVNELDQGADPELGEAIKHLIDNLWVPLDRSLIRIFTKVPKANKFVIEKVLMKRWTRHRHIRVEDPPSTKDSKVDGPPTKDTKADDSVSYSADSSKKHPVSVGKNASNESDNTEKQDLCVQITEVQHLFIGTCPSNPQAIRARSAGPAEMTRRGRQWYEVSLVSPAIETILKSNTTLEIGERTDDWRAEDLLGNSTTLFSKNSSSSTVASAIGSAGLPDLLRLTKSVVEKMDGIGYWNRGPCEAAAIAEAMAPGMTTMFTGRPGSMDVVRVEPKSLDFHDIKSIKHVGSDVGGEAKEGAAPAVPPTIEEQDLEDLEYW